MNGEQERIVQEVSKKIGDLPRKNKDGEVDFHFLSSLSEPREGWIGLLTESLASAFSQDIHQSNPIDGLENAAAVLIAWAADVRQRRKPMQKPKIGTKIMVRVPGHYSRFLGEVNEQGEIWIDMLNRSYPSTDVQILSSPKPQPQPIVESPSLQENLRKSLQILEQKLHNHS